MLARGFAADEAGLGVVGTAPGTTAGDCPFRFDFSSPRAGVGGPLLAEGEADTLSIIDAPELEAIATAPGIEAGGCPFLLALDSPSCFRGLFALLEDDPLLIPFR